MRRLLLKQVGEGGEAYGGFRWPLEVGARVEAPDWDPTPECGGGLHCWLYGEGDPGAGDGDGGGVWLVVSTTAEHVDLRRKVKIPWCVVEFVGDRESAVTWLQSQPEGAGRAVIYGTATAGDRGTATVGDCGTATAGDCGTLLMSRWDSGAGRRRWTVVEVTAELAGVSHRVTAEGHAYPACVDVLVEVLPLLWGAP